MNCKEKTTLMDETATARAIMRISHEIIERNKGVEDLALIGIVTRGAPLAEKIRNDIEKIEGKRVETGYVDITLYRDDLSEISDMPKVKKTDVPFSIKDKNVVLCDDVLYTGRTARAAMEAVHLPNTFADKSPFMLSGGEKRRVAIAGVLALHPRILILDEPTAGLDPRARESLLLKLQELKDGGMGIVLISHNMEDILRLADEVAILKEGEVVLQGAPREVFMQTETLRAANLEPPPLLHLLAELKHHGLPLARTAFTEEAAVQEILTAIQVRGMKPC